MLDPILSVLIVADPGRVAELASALSAPLPQGELDVMISSGGDDTIDLFGARHPTVVVITASLEVGDTKSLIETLRGMVPRTHVAIVLVGDDTGPIRNALDASELEPDRFVTRPLAEKALRFAVQSCIEAVALRSGTGSEPRTTDRDMGVVGTEMEGGGLAPTPGPKMEGGGFTPTPGPKMEGGGFTPTPGVDDDPTASTRAAMRARWEALADSIGDDVDDAIVEEPQPEADPLPPLLIQPRGDHEAMAAPHSWQPGTTDAIAPNREETLIISEPPPMQPPDMPVMRASRPSEPPPQHVVVAERGPDESWSEPIQLAELVDKVEREAALERGELRSTVGDEIDQGRLDDFDEALPFGSADARQAPIVD